MLTYPHLFLNLFPDMVLTPYVGSDTMKATSRKLKVLASKLLIPEVLELESLFSSRINQDSCKFFTVNLQVYGYNLDTDKTIVAGNVNLEDYHPIDPVPSSKASLKPGPIQHGSPLIPFIPKPSPPGHPKPGGFF